MGAGDPAVKLITLVTLVTLGCNSVNGVNTGAIGVTSITRGAGSAGKCEKQRGGHQEDQPGGMVIFTRCGLSLAPCSLLLAPLKIPCCSAWHPLR